MKKSLAQSATKLILLISLFFISFNTLQATNSKVLVNDGEKKYCYSDNFSSYDVQLKGEIKVNDNDTEIVSISPGGYLKVSKKTFGNKRSIDIESNSLGKITFKYYEGRSEKPYNPEGRKWLADILLDIVRLTGIDADGRVARIHAKKGVDGVLEEILLIPSNSTQSKYFGFLLDDYQLSTDDITSICATVSHMTSNTERGMIYRKYSKVFMKNEATTVAYLRGIARLTSNTEIASILTSIDGGIEFNNDKLTEAYFSCVDRMTSNTEIGRVLRNVPRSQNMTDDAYIRLFESVRRMTSNTEMGSVMRSLDKLNMNNPNISDAWFNALNRMTSNTEAGSTLRNLMRDYQLNKDNYISLLLTVRKLTSNTEIGSVLRAIPDLKLDDAQITDAYFLAIRSISSNTERGSVMRNTIRKMKMDDYAWENMLNSIAMLTSNTEMSSVLSSAIDEMPFDDGSLDAFFRAVNSMTSNTERSRILRKLTRNENFDKNACLKVLESARTLTSSTEKSTVLRAVAETEFIKDKAVKSEYKATASTLISDSDYRKAIEALID